jgi:phenylalanyl-tRNA synthetase beta chain
MQIPLKWINELVTIESINLEELVDKLTLGGFEVEEIVDRKIENETQVVLDLSATANRSDSLSIQGISKEIITLFKNSGKLVKYTSELESWKKKINKFSNELSNQSKCSFFVAVSIENLTNHKVPNWIQRKLLSSDMVVTNTLLDFKNYVLLETGYPFAYYDFEKICSKLNSKNLIFSCSTVTNHEKFIDATDSISELDSSTILIKANHLPLSIAGICENKEFCYSNQTNSLLIEASIFEATTIRQQSRQLGLRTERSARYEKSLKNQYLLEALYRLLSLLKLSNPNLTYKLHTIGQLKKQPYHSILLNYEKVKEVLGPINPVEKTKGFHYLKPELITDYLTSLKFNFLYDPKGSRWKIRVPEIRKDDITREIDLIEEIGRLHGFDNFLTTLPRIKKIGKEDISYKTRKKITSCLLNLGFNELIHYSLVNSNTFLKNEIRLINPLLSECSNLRSSLLPNLIQTIQGNLKQGNLILEGFEYGHIFFRDTSQTVQEKEYVAGIFHGTKKKLNGSDSDQTLTWYEAKGKIEQFLKQFTLSVHWKASPSKSDKILHPYRTSDIYLSTNLKLGRFGQIHPILASQLNIFSEIYLFEFDLENLQESLQTNKLRNYREYSLYPKIFKDLSFIIQKDIPFQEIETSLYSNGTQFLSEINLLDEYTGESIPQKHKSLCLQLVFQSQRTTLENKKIETILKNLRLVLVDKFHATIRS